MGWGRVWCMQGRGNNVVSNKLITIFKQTLSRISPKISLGPDPMSDFSISLEMNPKSNDMDEILQLPEQIAQRKGGNIVVCIVETGVGGIIEKVQRPVEPDVVYSDRKALLAGKESFRIFGTGRNTKKMVSIGTIHNTYHRFIFAMFTAYHCLVFQLLILIIT